MKYIQNKMQDSKFANIVFLIFLVLFSKYITFSWKKDNPVGKVAIDEDELGGIEINGILKFID